MEFKHQPVLVKEVLQFLPEKSRVIIDGTLGGGGHSKALLCESKAKSLKSKVIGIDRDLEAIFAAKKNLAEFENQITFIHPLWINDEQIELVQKMNENNYSQIEDATRIWYASILESEQSYNLLLKLGWQPQQARSILPNSLKTEIVVTANIREWRTIFKQRTAKAAHPQMRELMCPLLDELKTIVPIVFDDITY